VSPGKADQIHITKRLGHAPITEPIQLDPVTRAHLQHGDWDIKPEGNPFKRMVRFGGSHSTDRPIRPSVGLGGDGGGSPPATPVSEPKISILDQKRGSNGGGDWLRVV